MANKPIVLKKPNAVSQRASAKPSVGLYPGYGANTTPGFADSHVGSAESQSLAALYKSRTGQDLSAQPDPQAALRSAGLIHSTPTSVSHSTYASAADAIDAQHKKSDGGGSWWDSVVNAIESIPSAIANVPSPFLVNIGKPLSDAQKAGVEAKGGTVYGANNLGGFFELYTTPGMKAKDVQNLGQEPHRAKDIQATYSQLVSQQKNAAESMRMKSFLDAAKQHQSAGELQSLQDSLALGPLSGKNRFALLKLANKNGWAIANPRDYSDADLARRAFTLAGPALNEALAQAGRQVGNLASIPAGMVSIASQLYDAAKTGDIHKVVNMGEQFVQPYTYWWNDVQRRGFVPATSSFIRERPLDAILLASGAASLSGKAAGTATRATAAATDAAETSALGRLAEAAKPNRPIDVTVHPKGEGPALPATIGFTNKNLFGNLAQQARANVIERGLAQDSGVLNKYAHRVVSKRIVEKPLQHAATIADKASADALASIRDAATGLNFAQRERLIAELMRVRTLGPGNDIPLQSTADGWARKAEQYRTLAESAPKKTAASYRAQAVLFDGYATKFSELAKVPLDQSVIDAAVAAARPIANETSMAVSQMIDAVHAPTPDMPFDPRGVASTDTTFGALKPGDNFSDVVANQKTGVPAVVESVTPAADGSLSVSYKRLNDPLGVRVRSVAPSEPVAQLTAGVTRDMYVRDFVGMAEDLQKQAKARQAEGNVANRAVAAEASAPEIALRDVEKERVGLRDEIIKVAGLIEKNRADGNLGKVRYYSKMYNRRVSKLKKFLRKEEKLALQTGRTDLAAKLRSYREKLILTERKGKQGVTTMDARALMQDRLITDILSGGSSDALLRNIDQPEAVQRVKNAARMDQQAARLRELEQQLIAERKAAPTSASARAAEKKLADVRAEVDSLVRQSYEARGVHGGFSSALDNVESRFDAVRGAAKFIASKRGRDSLAQLSDGVLPGVLRVLGDLRAKVDQGLPTTVEDVNALAQAELSLASIEQRLQKMRSYKPDSVVKNAGKTTVHDVVGPSAHEGLLQAARSRAEYASTLEQRVAGRENLPPRTPSEAVASGVTPVPMSIVEVTRLRKAAEKSAQNMRREAARIVDRGRPIVSNSHFQAALDATGESVGVRVNLTKPAYYSIKRARGETMSDLMQRAELALGEPVMFLPTEIRNLNRGKGMRPVEKNIDIAPGSQLYKGRLKPNRGTTYRQGHEYLGDLWNRAMRSTGAVYKTQAWEREMRTFLRTIGVRAVLTDAEAAAYKGVSVGAEGLQYDPRYWVAVQASRLHEGVSNAAHAGTVNIALKGDATLADLFAKILTPEDVAKGGEYYMIPKFLYDETRSKLADIAYAPENGIVKNADRITKEWRAFTLNIIPRTGVANLVGSVALAALAGAGPRAFYLAYRHLKYGDVAAPSYLRQGYGATLTNEVQFAGIRGKLPTSSVKLPGMAHEWSLDDPLAGLSWWMNTMRKFNGISEDFGRLATYFSKALPAAEKQAGKSFWTTGRIISQEAQNYLELLAKDTPNEVEIANAAKRFTDYAFQWLGDLHSGGAANTRLRILIPFHQWYRHIIRLTLVTMPLHYPGRALFLQRLGDIGHEYLQAHGVYPGWMMDVIPILMDEKMINNVPQKYVLAWHTASINPFSTVGQAYSGDHWQAIDWLAGMANPMAKSLFEITASLLQGGGGTAKQISGSNILSDVKNQSGNPIGAYSGEGIQYYLNTVQQMLPLSSLAMTTSGQAANGNLLWNQSDKFIRGSQGAMPAEYQPSNTVGDVPGRDVLQLVTDFSPNNALALTARLVFGGSPTWVTSHGPIERSQFSAALNRYIADYKKELRNMMKSQRIVSQQNQTP